MRGDIHERAQKRIAASRIEGISQADDQWLNEHLAVCDRCDSEAQATAAALQAYRSAAAMAGPDLVARTKLAVHHRALHRQERHHHTVPLVIAAAIASLWILLTTPYTWSAFGWLGGVLGLSKPIWEVGFLVWWFLPASALAGVAAWKKIQRETTWSKL